MENKFEKVTVTQKANVYFDGKVNSRTVIKENGEKISLGFMVAGEYEFNTACKEVMEIIGGEMDAFVAGDDGWKTYPAGTSFSIPANSSFKARVKNFADYTCSFIDA